MPGGVGAAARKPAGIQRIALPIPKDILVHREDPDLIEEGRLLHVAIPAGTGRTVVHVLVYYGFVGARSGVAAAKAANEKVIRQVFRYAAALKGAPVLVAGDFNDEPDRSAALSEAIRTGEWTDLAQLQAYKSDPPAAPGHTFVTESGASRID